MSIPVGTNGAHDEPIDVPKSTPVGINVDAANRNAYSEKDSPRYDEYTTLLKKHLSLVESELSKLKSSQK